MLDSGYLPFALGTRIHNPFFKALYDQVELIMLELAPNNRFRTRSPPQDQELDHGCDHLHFEFASGVTVCIKDTRVAHLLSNLT